MTVTDAIQLGRQLQKYSTIEYILLGDLRELLEEPADEENRRWLLAILDSLADMLPREFQLKESGGYLQEVLDEFPSWSAQVDELHHQQHTLYARLRELRWRLAHSASYVGTADQLRCELRDWMAALTAHHRHENRMLQTALNLEVGTGD